MTGTDRIKRGLDKVADARNHAALGGEFAPDYKMVKGVKFYYKTVAHAWVMPYLQGMSPAAAGVAMLYALAHDADAVRNEVLPQIWDGTILTKATEFFCAHGIMPEDLNGLDLTLLENPYEPPDSGRDDTSKEAGAESPEDPPR